MTDAKTSLPRVLLVEDEEHLAAGLKLNFELDGLHVDVAATGREAGRLLLQEQRYDLIILDVMLPDVDGFSLCQKLREAGNTTPVLMLTARGATEDRVEGLNVGADDYLTKPFELEELRARMRSLMRRSAWGQRPEGRTTRLLELGDARIDFDSHEVTVRGEIMHLTALELELLRYFADNPGRVLGREELQQRVWKLNDYPSQRMVDNFIMRLRRHFEPDPRNPVMFVSVRGAGYKFMPPSNRGG
ncbi:MAG: response regulator transcription factor [Nannocystaceae bacterium]|nr:response regulator transcription factor [Nannocystaceae bacterium]